MSRRINLSVALTLVVFTTVSINAFAETESPETPAKQSDTPSSPFSERSPWLFTPIASSNPKLGTSFGALGGYLHFFDSKSRPSIFALSGQYSSTDSIVAAAYARTSFAEDHQRLLAALAFGNIKNDYDDYLGTGVPLRNEAELHSLVARYTYRVTGNWFLGGQAIYQDFAIAGQSSFDDQVLDILGIVPYKSAGAGLVVQNDSRDDENMPNLGWLLNFNNMAFRESLGGDNDYEMYRVEFKYFVPHGNRNVFALHQLNHLTSDAPTAARAPVQLRGYKVGQFTGEYMSSIEAEERLRLGEKWTATIFAGVACLYGDGVNCTDSESVFPMAGAGIQYILKPEQGIVANLEFADGEGSSYGIYLKMGYAF